MKGSDLSRQTRLLVRSLRVIIVALSGLMDDVNTRHLLHQFRQTLDHGLIDGMRALASAEDQQRGRSARRGLVRRSRRMLGAPAHR